MFTWAPYKTSAQLWHSSDLSELADGIVDAKRERSEAASETRVPQMRAAQTPAPAPLPPYRRRGDALEPGSLQPSAASVTSGAVAAEVIIAPTRERENGRIAA